MKDTAYEPKIEAIQEIAEDVGSLSVALADVAGHVDDVDGMVARQVRSLTALRGHAETMTEANAAVLKSAKSALSATTTARDTVREGEAQIATTVEDVASLVEQVRSFGSRIDGLTKALEQVSRVAADIYGIARMTNLLALNASIEAARAGSAGKGFMVVAQEVKRLSGHTQDATQEIDRTLQALSSEVTALAQIGHAAVDRAGTVRRETDSIVTVMNKIESAVDRIDGQQAQITEAAQISAIAIQQTETEFAGLAAELEQASGSLTSAKGRLNDLLQGSERLVAGCARLGVVTVDTPFIEAVREAAAAVSAAFEAEIDSGRMSLNALFDQDYRAITGSNPQQMMTRFVDMTDRVLPAIQEPLLNLSTRVVFCAAVDRNGFLPTHNRKFSQPQRPHDPTWNAANCRNRRIFADRVGLTAGQSTRPFCMQAYRRDMGGGQFAMMKDVSAPIIVQGRHWGGLRLAYRA